MLIVANWKAYVEDFAKAKELLVLSKKASTRSAHTIVLAPPAPFLAALALKEASAVAFAAQDVSLTPGGAQTGEVTAAAVKAAGAAYAFIGHSERRAAGDTPEIIVEKLTRAFAQDLTPILCVGERERDTDGRYLSFIREELTSALAPFSPKERMKIVIAYEPIWAIGKTAENAIGEDDLAEMILYIRKVLSELLPGKSSLKTPVLYGGSVEPENVATLAHATHIDGFLIGHASVDTVTFGKILKELSA